MKHVHTTRHSGTLSPKRDSLEKRATKRLILSVESLKVTPEVQLRVSELALRAKKAKEAGFLDKYRIALNA